MIGKERLTARPRRILGWIPGEAFGMLKTVAERASVRP